MSSKHKAWSLLAMLVLGGSGAVAACTAEAGLGEAADLGNDAGAKVDATTRPGDGGGRDATTDRPATPVTPVQDSGRDTGATTPVYDAGSDARDAGADVVDANATLAAEGTPCAPANAVQQQGCGVCGIQRRICLQVGDAAAPTWQTWGACLNEVVNGCTPGTTTTGECGFCGSQVKICQSNCTYAAGPCTGEVPPATRCSPGETEFVEGLSCDAGGRSRTCGTGPQDAGGCQWRGYGACTVPPPDVTIASSAGGVVSADFTAVDRSDGGGKPQPELLSYYATEPCPVSVSTTDNSYRFLRVANPTNQTAIVSVWITPASDGGVVDTVLAVYSGIAYPTNIANCKGYVSDDCVDPTDGGYAGACQYGSSGLFHAEKVGDAGTAGVQIPPNGTVIVAVWEYASTAQFSFKVNVKTEVLQ